MTSASGASSGVRRLREGGRREGYLIPRNHMGKLTTTLLTGAALIALSAASAEAKPVLLDRNGLKVTSSTMHYKTDINGSPITVVTLTLPSETFTGNHSTMYKKTKDLAPGEVWLTLTANGAHCSNATGKNGQKAKFSKDPNARIKAYTYKSPGTHTFFTSQGATGHCTGTLTLYAPAYELKSKTATADTFDGYNAIRFTTTTTTTGTKHKKHENKFEFVAKEPWTINIE